MPDQLPKGAMVSFTLINKTKYLGRFIFSYIEEGHTFQDLLDYWNGPMGQVERPSFITEIGLWNVNTGGRSQIAAPVVLSGTYAFHCGYPDDTGKVIGFFHELRAA